VSDVLHDIIRSLQDIVRAEVRLAKVELKADAQDIVRSGLWLFASAASIIMAVGFLLWTAVYALAEALPAWGATLVVAVALAFIGAALGAVGMRKVRRLRPIPERTIASVKENLEWMKSSTN
jgi:hypothetical protein